MEQHCQVIEPVEGQASFCLFSASQYHNIIIVFWSTLAFFLLQSNRLYRTNSRCFTFFEKKGYLFSFQGCYKWWMFMLLQLIESKFITKFLMNTIFFVIRGYTKCLFNQSTRSLNYLSQTLRNINMSFNATKS